MIELLQLLERTRDITQKDAANGHDAGACLGSLIAELGEWSIARQVEQGIRIRPLEESSLSEAVDVWLCASALFFVGKGDISQLIQIGNQKLNKWENNQKRIDIANIIR